MVYKSMTAPAASHSESSFAAAAFEACSFAFAASFSFALRIPFFPPIVLSKGSCISRRQSWNKYPFRLRSVAQNCAVPFNCAKVPGDRVSQWNSRSRDVFIMCTDVSWIAAGMPRCHITHAENGLSAAFRYGTLTPEACVPPAVLAAHLQNVGAMVQDDPNKHVATAPMPAVLNSHLLMTLSSVSYGRNSLPTTLRLRWTWHVGATVRKIIIRCCSNARLRMRITLNSRKQL